MKKGFTLVELLLYMGIFSILLMVFVQVFVSIIDVQLSGQETSSVNQDGRFLISRLLFDINRAQAITLPSVYASSSGTLQLTINSSSYTYSVSNGILNLAALGNTDVLTSIDTSISGFTVKRFSNTKGKDSVQIIFTLTGNTTNHTHTKSQVFETAGGLR